ncbi:MAG TPA: hypothetical protein ENK15_07300 [Thermopetrobacter sp.]|nr:hypothetical protein [Thermopetrobacter sp.]
MQPGEGFHTRFSGFTTDADGRTIIDVNGIVGSLMGLAGAPKGRGQHWLNEPQRMFITAAQTGQVFGIAFDDAQPPNIYLTATSAFGLHTDGAGNWMAGMWGPKGGPGTIWKLNAANNYQPEIFARVTLDGRANSGPALGNIAYDAAHKQLFVSDLETGMIHRFGLKGNELGRFDHGVQGRSDFLNAASGTREARPVVAFDPASTARLADCPSGAFDRTPACWNYADFRRRVYGLAVRQDAKGRVRLYYSVWGSAAFGNPQWATAGADKANSVWSIGIGADGRFDPADVRLEFTLPAFFTAGAPRAGQGVSHAVSDIAFKRCGPQADMALAERGMVRNLRPGQRKPFAFAHESRVLRYKLLPSGVWQVAGRHDVGFRLRANPPILRSNAAGGVDFGYGRKADGIDLAKPDARLWMSGDSLCSPEGRCANPASGLRDDGSEVHGLAGLPANIIAPLIPSPVQPAAIAGGGEPRGPLNSVMIDSDINVGVDGQPLPEELSRDDATRPGDVEVYRTCAVDILPAAAPVPVEAPQPPPVSIPTPPPPPPAHTLRISHNKLVSSGHYRSRSWHTRGRSWHYRTRSWHYRSLSWHYRTRSWHYRYGSWHVARRSWHYRTSSWHTARRSWHYKTRSWHTLRRSWHFKGRSWHNPRISWHSLRRSWHWRGRSWHVKGRSWHSIGRSWHIRGRSWHNKLRSWHVRGRTYHSRPRSYHVVGRTWHTKGRSYHLLRRSWHTKGRSIHVKGRSWHNIGRSWHVKGRSYHNKLRSWHVKGRTFHVKPRSWHVVGRTWHAKGRSYHLLNRSWHVKGRSIHVKGRSWHATGRTWHTKGRSYHQVRRSWHTKGRSFHDAKRSRHVKGRSYHAAGRSWHTKGRSYHQVRRSWHTKGRSFHDAKRSRHVKGRSYHQVRRSWHAAGRSFHTKGRSYHQVRRSWHLKGRSFHDARRSTHGKGRSAHNVQRSLHTKGRSYHVRGRSFGQGKPQQPPIPRLQ